MTELVVISAANETALLAEIDRLVAFLDRVRDVSLPDVAYTASQTVGESVIALVVDSVVDLRARLASARSRLAAGNLRRIRDKSGTYYFRDHLLGEGRGRLAFLFPGVTSFYPDMMRDLIVEHAECRGVFDELEEAFSHDAAFTPSSFVFPPAAYYRHDADVFSSGAYAQAFVATYAGCAALSRLLTKLGVLPEGVVGFAGGDLAALMRSGTMGGQLPRPERVAAIREIYRIIDKAVNHSGLPKVTMASVVLRREDEFESLLSVLPPEKVRLAVDLSPRQKTFAIDADYAEEAFAVFAAHGIRVMRLGLDRPFNTSLCEPCVPSARRFAAARLRQPPVVDIYSCTTPRALKALKSVREDMAERWSRPVRFADTVRRMYEDGYRVFLEVGPRGLLSSAVADTLRGCDHAALAMNSIHRSGMLQLHHALAQLAAHGCKLNLADDYERRGATKLDFDAVLSLEVRKDSEMKLSRAFPRLMLPSEAISAATFLTEPKRRGAKAAQRAAAVAQLARRQRQFDFGTMNPLVSDADTVSSIPGVSVELAKVFKLAELPFISDFALGSSQLSYSQPNLKGLVLLTLPLGIEIMAEAASLVLPNRVLARVEDLTSRRMVSFSGGEAALRVRAERIAAAAAEEIAVKVLLREDSPDGAFTWPVMEATFVFTATAPASTPVSVEPLGRPRSVHWSGRDIYPMRLCAGRRLRCVTFVEAWGEKGIDYDIVVPPLAGNVVFTRFPLWAVNPLLLETVVSGFSLWRSHEPFSGAASFPFRMRRLTLKGVTPGEGSRLKCYLRLTGVTPRSHICDITVTDGNGKELLTVAGWEELTERVPVEYRQLVMQPAMCYLSNPLDSGVVGEVSTDYATAFIVDPPYRIFERNEEIWLRIFSHIILCADERKDFKEMTGSVSRRTEWLFGRIAAKEAVRRFLKDFYQARWSDADIQIWPDDSGKPHALGAWSEYLTTDLDVAIAHTSQFVVAVAAANARVGVDVESVSRDLSDEFAIGVFTPDELELAAHALKPSQALIRFWCAKEAVSKALGTGIRYSPREMIVAGYVPETGALTMRLEGAWLEAFKAFKGRDIPVAVRTVRDHALATCFIPATLFATE